MLAQLVYLISLNNVGRIPDVINVGWDSYNKSVNSTRYTRELLQSLDCIHGKHNHVFQTDIFLGNCIDYTNADYY